MLEITQSYILCIRINPYNKKIEYRVCENLEIAKVLCAKENGWKWQYVKMIMDDGMDEIKKVVK